MEVSTEVPLSAFFLKKERKTWASVKIHLKVSLPLPFPRSHCIYSLLIAGAS